MIDPAEYFRWPVQITHFYLYFLIAASITFYLVYKSSSKYKFELFFLSFYLLTGNLNKLLTISIPGFSLFEIQPRRFLFFMFSFFLIRKIFFSNLKVKWSANGNIPWFELMLVGFIFFLVISQLYNVSHVGLGAALNEIIGALTFLVIIKALQLMSDRNSYELIGKVIIISACISSVVSIIQLAGDPLFLRIGDDRAAFGAYLRSNGIFRTEYFNSYFLITAFVWTIYMVKNRTLRYSLMGLYTIGVITSFQRMSWVILLLIVVIYFVFIESAAFEKLALAALSGLALVLLISIFYYRDIMNSTVVQERLSDSVGGRMGYYSLVFSTIGEKPLFGFGDLNNEDYYHTMLQITNSRERAAGEIGDLHSGYFSSLYLYGVPAFITFTLFAVLAVVYFARLYSRKLFYSIPFLVGLLFMIGNLTNTLLFLKYFAMLYSIHLGVGMGMRELEEKSESVN